MQLDDILQQLRQERDRITTAINALSGSAETPTKQTKRRGRPAGTKNASTQSQSSPASSPAKAAKRKKRTLSPESRAKMAEAAKRRWANAKKK
jgi:hypothetical protein